MKILRARLLDLEREKQDQAVAAERRGMVSTGERSMKVRTYNYPQNRVTDHRIGLTLYNLDHVIDGDLAQLIQSLQAEDVAERLKESAVA